jgi:hypothetical protein
VLQLHGRRAACRRIAPKRDEIRDLAWFHPVALADLSRTYAGHLAAAARLQDGGRGGCKLEHVAISARDEGSAAPRLFLRDGRGEKIVSLEPGAFAH